jgi:Ca-activated chloride channel family protein
MTALREWAAALGIDGWREPDRLWLAAALALAAVALAAATRPAAVGWPAAEAVGAARPRRLDPVRGTALALRAGALLALAAVLAAPYGVHRAAPEPGRGLDLVLAVDASGSMRALDAHSQAAGWRTRLDLAREVVARFAAQRAAEGDRVALVVFGASVATLCPLTSDGALLRAALGRVRAGMAGEATALGDALGLAVRRAAAAREGAGPAGRVVVLLTDGRTNTGALSLDQATALAVGEQIRVHAVAIGTAGEAVAIEPAPDAAVPVPRLERHDVDRAALERVAAATGGRFFAAQRSADLDAVYRDIDALERVERRLPPRLKRRDRPEPLLALAGGLVVGEIALARAARRRVP